MALYNEVWSGGNYFFGPIFVSVQIVNVRKPFSKGRCKKVLLCLKFLTTPHPPPKKKNLFLEIGIIKFLYTYVCILYMHTAGFLKKSFFSVHSFNEHFLSIPQYTSSWGNRFKDTHGICLDEKKCISNYAMHSWTLILVQDVMLHWWAFLNIFFQPIFDHNYLYLYVKPSFTKKIYTTFLIIWF